LPRAVHCAEVANVDALLEHVPLRCDARVEPATPCETAAHAIEQRFAAHLLCVAFEAFNERGLA